MSLADFGSRQAAALETQPASERHHREVFEHTTDAIFLLDVDGEAGFLLAGYNPAAERLTGLSSREVEGKRPAEVFPSALAEAMNARTHQCLEEGTAITYEERLSLPHGDVWCTTTMNPLRDEGGRIIRILGVAHDITERKCAEQRLAASELRYRTLAESSQDLIFIVGRDDRVQYVNAAAARGLGLRAEEIVGGPRHRLFAPEVAEAQGAALERVFATGEPLAPQVERLFPGGEVWLDTSLVPLKDATGEVTAVFGVARDVTERKRAQTALEAAASEWRQTFDAMRDSVAVCNADGQVLRCNAATKALTGYDFPDAIGRRCCEVFHSTREDHPQCPRRRALRSGRAETSFIEQDGQWLRIAFEPQLDEGGRVYGGVHVVANVTELKQTEQRLRDSIVRQQRITDGVIAALAHTIEVRDPYTAGHQRRVSELAAAMARLMGFDDEHVLGARVAGTLHDIGKITIPAEILSRPGKLSAMEYELIKGHAQAGFEVLESIDFPWPVAEIALQHHERLDGSGYPRGLRGEEILPEARILAVADVVEAMASHRPYRAALPLEAALAEIEEGAGSRYDSAVSEACQRLFREEGFTLDQAGRRDSGPSELGRM